MKNLLTVLVLIIVFLAGAWSQQEAVFAAPKTPVPSLVKPPSWATAKDFMPESALVREIRAELTLRRFLPEVMTHYNPRLTLDEQRAITEAILQAAKTYELDPLFIMAVIAAESSFAHRKSNGEIVSSPCGALGIMQIMPLHGWRANLHSIEGNIDTGAWYLRLNKDRFSRDDLTVAAYNAGPGAVQRARGIPRIAETQRHVKRVMGIYTQLKKNIQQMMAQSSLQNPS